MKPQTNPTEPSMNKISKRDKIGLLVLFFVYTFQSTTLGFMGGSLIAILSEAGAKFSDLGALTLITLPLSAKFFLAPILDTYYSRSLGKRKTYLIPAQYLHGILALVLSFHIEEWIRTRSIFPLAVFGCCIAICVSIQDTALDGWIVTLLSEKAVPYFSTVGSISQALGGLLGNQLIVTLNSIVFCNKYFYSTPQKEPLITLSGFFFNFSLIVLAVNTFIQLLIKERNPRTTSNTSLTSTIRMLGGFWKNTNLRLLCFFILTFRLMYGPVDCSAGLTLIQKGFSKDHLSAIQIFALPIQFLIAIVAGNISAKKQEFRMIIIAGILKLVENVTWFLMAYNFDPETNYSKTFVISLFLQMSSNVINGLLFVSLGGFFGRISNEENGGTFTTCLSSFMNLGEWWVRLLCYNLLEQYSLIPLAIACWLYGGVYFFLIGSYLQKLQCLDKTSFSPFQNAKISNKDILEKKKAL